VHQVGDQTKDVNKQEFSASSWRSNQGYTKMHGQLTIKKISTVSDFHINKKQKIEQLFLDVQFDSPTSFPRKT